LQSNKRVKRAKIMTIMSAQSEAWADVEQRDADYLAALQVTAIAERGLHRVDVECAKARAEGYVHGEVETLSVVPHPRQGLRSNIGATLTEHCAEL
jgi:hypothetical protein